MAKAKVEELGAKWMSYYVGDEKSKNVKSYIAVHGGYVKERGTVAWTLRYPLRFYTFHGHFIYIPLEVFPIIQAEKEKLPTSICGGGEVWNYKLEPFTNDQLERAVKSLEKRQIENVERIEIITLQQDTKSSLGTLLNALNTRRLTSNAKHPNELDDLEWEINFLACRSDREAVKGEVGERAENEPEKTIAQENRHRDAKVPIGYFDRGAVERARIELREKNPALMQTYLRELQAEIQQRLNENPGCKEAIEAIIATFKPADSLPLSQKVEKAKLCLTEIGNFALKQWAQGDQDDSKDAVDVNAWRTQGLKG